MGGVLILGLIVGLWMVANWAVELRPFMENRYQVTKPSKYFLVRLGQGLYGICINMVRFFLYGKYFILDLIMTVLVTSMFAMGDSAVGGILGMGLSNFLSALIIYYQWKDTKKLKLAEQN